MLLATVSDLAGALGEELPEQTAQLYLRAASAAIRRTCGWHIAGRIAEDELTVDGSGARVQLLPSMLIHSLVAVVEEGVPLDVDAQVAAGSLQWTDVGYLWRSIPWTRTLGGLQVTLDHGYAEVPDELRLLAAVAAGRAYAAGPSVATSESAGALSVSYGPGAGGAVTLLEYEVRQLEPYMLGNRT